MVITNLEHRSLIAPENDAGDLDLVRARQVKGGLLIGEIGGGRTVKTEAKAQGKAQGNIAVTSARVISFIFNG